MKVLNIDCDGVLYDFTAAMTRAFVSQGYRDAGSWNAMTTWALEVSWPVTKGEVVKVMHEGILDGIVFGTGPLLDDEIPTVLRTLRDDGWHLRIVTAKTFSSNSVTLKARQSTLEWLDRNAVPYDTIAFTDTHGKLDYRADAIIDDKPDLSWMQHGAFNLLYDHPWNRTTPTVTLPVLVPAIAGDVVRVKDWNEALEVLS